MPTSSLSLVGGLHSSATVAGVRRISGLMSALNSMETMQKSVMNAFALKYSEFHNNAMSIGESPPPSLPPMQRLPPAVQKCRMTICSIWVFRCMVCLQGFHFTLHYSTHNSNSSKS